MPAPGQLTPDSPTTPLLKSGSGDYSAMMQGLPPTKPSPTEVVARLIDLPDRLRFVQGYHALLRLQQKGRVSLESQISDMRAVVELINPEAVELPSPGLKF